MAPSGPDEYHDAYPGSPAPGLDDNAYTNVTAAWVLTSDEHGMDPAGIPSAATSFRPVLLGLDTRSPDGTVHRIRVR
ncbi:hypothetical protein ACFYMI_35480 [Streptomyces collinus]|uniref:hypothetical protein n=1 Tax=Streptomyces collinus TaxID=42684 RepID=UPI0036737B68